MKPHSAFEAPEVTLRWFVSAHPFTTFLASTWKDEGLPVLFQVPDVSSKARKNQHDLMSLRHKRLSSACQEKKMVQPGTVINPDYLKLSFENFVSQRMMNLHQCRSQTEPKPSRENMATGIQKCWLSSWLLCGQSGIKSLELRTSTQWKLPTRLLSGL
ncbi:uncharacterized protein C1orf105 homolog isoform X3 [Marmota flaviventris]|uniref:uncharacterized protein C1orf105 homolog isoform X3 n=1 Tax=Marmota flaviventris TaxID=93162 RepID=UPI003A89FAD0